MQYYKKNNEKCLYYAQKKFELYHSNLSKMPHQLHEYFVCANNVLYLNLAEKKYSEAEKNLNQLGQVLPWLKSTSDKGYFYSVYYTNYLRYINQSGHFTELEQSLPKILKEFAVYEKELAEMEKVELMINFAVAYFGIGNYKATLKILNKIRNELAVTSHPYIENFIRIFYVIVHYEMAHDDLLPHLAQSTYRYVQQKEGANAFEKKMAGFLRGIVTKNRTEDERKKEFEKMKSLTLKLSADKSNAESFEFFDFAAWLTSKMANRSYGEILLAGS